MSRKLEGKIALITGAPAALELQSPSVSLRTERTWPDTVKTVINTQRISN
jgi:hypothetical protein